MAPIIRGNSLYSFVAGSTWAQAEANAVSLGGYLIGIDDQAENDYVFNTFNTDDRFTYSGSTDRAAWIGVYYNAQGWTDVSTQSAINFSCWAPSQPNKTLNGEDSNYVILILNDTAGDWDAKWADTLIDNYGVSTNGIAEVPLTLSTALPTTIREGAGEFTVNIDLSAGTTSQKHSLVQGTRVWYVVAGIDTSDLETGYALQNSGVIDANGNIVVDGASSAGINLALRNDGVAEADTLSIQLYSVDPTTTTEVIADVQVGNKSTQAVVESTPVVRGNSLYLLAPGNSWSQAEADSVALGGHLVTINDAEENTFVSTTFNPSKTVAIFGGPQRWIGFNDIAIEGEWVWTSGQSVTFTNWASPTALNSAQQPDNFTEQDYGVMNFTAFDNWDDARLDIPTGGIAEIPLTLSITRSGTPKEGAAPFTTSINLSAGNGSENLANGATIYWTIKGITDADLLAGSVKGDGVISGGKLDIQHQLKSDSDVGEEFTVEVYSDEARTQLIGEASSTPVQEAFPIIRGNSLYHAVTGPTWNEAESNALTLGGHLAIIGDANENEFLRVSFDSNPLLFKGGQYNEYAAWFGLTYDFTNARWVDILGNEQTYFNWAYGQPDAPNDNLYGQRNTTLILKTDYFWTDGSWDDSFADYNTNYLRNGIAEIPFIRRGDSAYVIVKGPTWEQAETNANALGGHLVTINDQAENQWIANNLAAEARWIGYSDRATEGTWQWSDGTPKGYESWSTNQPDNSRASDSINGQDFAVTGSLGLWDDGENPFWPGISLLSGIAEIKLAPNNAPAGNPALNSASKVTEILTIDKSALQDADNFSGYMPTYKYSWEASNDSGTTWTPISSADATDNNASFTLTAGQLGNQVRGVVSYLDGYGTNEVVKTDASAKVTPLNQTPTDIALSSLKFDENISANSIVATLSTLDPDSSDTSFVYSLVDGTGSTDNAAFTISQNKLSINSSPDYEKKNSYSILLQTTDLGGLSFQKALTLNVNDLIEPGNYKGTGGSSIKGTILDDTYSGTGAGNSFDGDAGYDRAARVGDLANYTISGTIASSTVESITVVSKKTGVSTTKTDLEAFKNVESFQITGGTSNNVITAGGGTFGSLTRSAFSGTFIASGGTGVDTITGGTFKNWLAGRGFASGVTNGVETITGTTAASSADYFDLRNDALTGAAYVGGGKSDYAKIANFNPSTDRLVLSGTSAGYKLAFTQLRNAKTQAITDEYWAVSTSGGDLIAQVRGNGLGTLSGSVTPLVLYGTGDQSTFGLGF